MIPKIIHYCWFGRGEKPKKIQECINSWYQHLPDYQIIEWNEDNFDVNALQYTKDAYEAKKYAFVSDVARVKALYEMGGIYLDTDVVVFKSFDEILNNKCVLGFESENYVATSFMASEPKYSLMKEFYDLYTDIKFYDENGNIVSGTNVSKLTDMLLNKGLKRNNRFQTIENDIVIYPKEYFSPYEYGYGVYQYTDNTICVHHFEVSWLPKRTKYFRIIKKYLCKIIGYERTKKLRNFIKENRCD